MIVPRSLGLLWIRLCYTFWRCYKARKLTALVGGILTNDGKTCLDCFAIDTGLQYCVSHDRADRLSAPDLSERQRLWSYYRHSPEL